MCYTQRFDTKKCLERMREHIEWRNNVTNHQMDERSKQMLETGFIYQLGRDKGERPVIYLDARKINADDGKENIIKAISIFLGMVKKYMFVDYAVENWVIVLDLHEMGLGSIPIKALGAIIGAMSTNFCATLERMFIINPSGGLKFLWGTVTAFMDDETSDKIRMIKQKEIKIIQEQIPNVKYIQKAHGGELPDVTGNFWPPRDLFTDFEALKIQKEKELQKQKEAEEEKKKQLEREEEEKKKKEQEQIKQISATGATENDQQKTDAKQINNQNQTSQSNNETNSSNAAAIKNTIEQNSEKQQKEDVVPGIKIIHVQDQKITYEQEEVNQQEFQNRIEDKKNEICQQEEEGEVIQVETKKLNQPEQKSSKPPQQQEQETEKVEQSIREQEEENLNLLQTTTVEGHTNQIQLDGIENTQGCKCDCQIF